MAVLFLRRFHEENEEFTSQNFLLIKIPLNPTPTVRLITVCNVFTVRFVDHRKSSIKLKHLNDRDNCNFSNYLKMSA